MQQISNVAIYNAVCINFALTLKYITKIMGKIIQMDYDWNRFTMSNAFSIQHSMRQYLKTVFKSWVRCRI